MGTYAMQERCRPHARKETLDQDVARALGVPLKQVRELTACFLEHVRAALAEDGIVQVDGLGRLRVQTHVAAMAAAMPQPKGEKAVRHHVYFKKARLLSKALKEGSTKYGKVRSG
jgi:nucleoid DNA-binding protein